MDSPVFSGEEKTELKDAYQSTKRLQRLTEDLTKYAQDVRFGRLNPQVFTLGVLHTQIQFDFQSQFSEKNLHFVAQYTPKTCAEWQVCGDYYRISQVCNNLIQNAVKFTSAGGRVVMRIKTRGKQERPKDGDDKCSVWRFNTQISAQPCVDDSGIARSKECLDWDVEYFELEFEDNGIGIAEVDLNKVFEPWHQLADGKSYNEGYGGIGLGLAICQFWVTKMDGKIEVFSRRAATISERGWTVFKILLPLRVNRPSPSNSTKSIMLSVSSVPELQSNKTSEPPPLPVHEIKPESLSEAIMATTPQQISRKQNCRILIAEDEPINQRVVQRMLMKDGFQHITLANNGFEAIEAVSRAEEAGQQFNLILMDFQMPHVDGPLATAVIRRIPHITQDRLIIIALTAYDDDKSKRDCLASGMNDFVTKPIRHAVLRAILMKHLSLLGVAEDEDEDDGNEAIASVSVTHLANT